MILGVLYDSSGKITGVAKVSNYQDGLHGVFGGSGVKYGIVRTAPVGLDSGDIKGLANYRVSQVFDDGTVEVKRV